MSVVANVAINVDATKAVQQLKAVDAASKGVKGGLDTASAGAKGLGGALQAALGPLLAVATAVTAVQKSLSVAFERGAAEQRLKNLTSSTGEYEAALAAAKSAADKFGMSQTDATQAFAEAYGRLNSLGFGLKEVNEVYVGFNNAARAAGVSVEDSNGAFVQLAQGMSAGVLNGENLVTILERMPQLGKLLADSMGVSAGEIKKLGSEGKITTDVIYKALKQSADAAGDLNGKLTEQQKAFNSLGRATDSLLNSIGKLFEPGVIAGAKALAAAAEEIGTFFSMLASKLFPEVKESAEELSSVFKKTDDTVLNLKNAFKGFLQTAAFIGTLALSLKAVAIGTAAVVAVTKAWAIATAAVGAAKAFIMGLLGNLPALAAGFVAATAASVALGAGLDKVGVEMDEFKRQQAEAEAKAKGTVDNYSSMAPKIEDAKEKTKQLKKAQDAVTKAIETSSQAIDKMADAQTAGVDRILSVTNARIEAEKAINNVLLEQAQRQLDGANSQQERVKAAGRILDLTIEQAKLERESAYATIEAEKIKLDIAVSSAKLKEQEVRLAVELARTQGTVLQAHYDTLSAATELVSMAVKQQSAGQEIAKYQKQAADASFDGAKSAANAAYQSNITVKTSAAVATNTTIAAESAGKFAANLERGAQAAVNASKTVGFLSATGGAFTASAGAGGIQNEAVRNQMMQTFNEIVGSRLPENVIATNIEGFSQTVQNIIQQENTPSISSIPNPSRERLDAMMAENAERLRMQTAQTATATSSPSNISPQVSIQTGPVTQMNGTNYVTVADMEKSMQTVVNSLLSNGRTAGGRHFAGIR